MSNGITFANAIIIEAVMQPCIYLMVSSLYYRAESNMFATSLGLSAYFIGRVVANGVSRFVYDCLQHMALQIQFAIFTLFCLALPVSQMGGVPFWAVILGCFMGGFYHFFAIETGRMIVLSTHHLAINFWYNVISCVGFLLGALLLATGTTDVEEYEDPDLLEFKNELFYFLLCLILFGTCVFSLVLRLILMIKKSGFLQLNYSPSLDDTADIKALTLPFKDALRFVKDHTKEAVHDRKNFIFQGFNEINGNVVRIGPVVMLVQAAYLMTNQHEETHHTFVASDYGLLLAFLAAGKTVSTFFFHNELSNKVCVGLGYAMQIICHLMVSILLTMLIMYHQLLKQDGGDSNKFYLWGFIGVFAFSGIIDSLHSRLARSMISWDEPILRRRWNRMCDFGSDFMMAIFAHVGYWLFFMSEYEIREDANIKHAGLITYVCVSLFCVFTILILLQTLKH